jgi:hypothetical protein
MKVLHVCPGDETHTVGTGMIKRLIHSYLEHRNKRRTLRCGSAENKIVAPYEGRRWCDSTERELIGNIMSGHGYL